MYKEEEDENTGVLSNMRCPECESRGPFGIEVLRWVTVYDSGDTDEEGGDTEWGYSSRCRCLDCGNLATVEAFTKGVR